MINPADGPELPSLRNAAQNLDPTPEQRDRIWEKFSRQAAGLKASRDGAGTRARWLLGGLFTGVALLTAACLRVSQWRAHRAGGDESASEE